VHLVDRLAVALVAHGAPPSLTAPSRYRRGAAGGYEVAVRAPGPASDEVADVATRLGTRAEGWTAQPLGPGVAGATAGLWRVRGAGWSAVCKVGAHSEAGHANWRTASDEEHPMYWRRETVAYCSGFLAGVVDGSGSGIAAPGVIACFDRDDRSTSVWMEDVRGLAGAAWPLVGYAVAARALGRLQGGLVAGDAVPDERWLSRGWLRAYVERRTEHAAVLLDDAQWSDVPETARPAAALRERAVALWHDRDRLFDALDAVPRTLCHLDFHPDNLIGVTTRDGESRVVVLDWAYCGIGALGEDIGNLVPDSVFDMHVDPSTGPMLQEYCVGAYLMGLADAGWDGDERVVRLGVAASAALKFTWMVPHLLMSARGDFPAAAVEARYGVPADEVIARRSAMCAQLVERYDEALALAAELGVA
jgi:hypothetical protein